MPSTDVPRLLSVAPNANFQPGTHALDRFKQNILGAVPQHQLAERTHLIAALDDRQKMISRELTDLAGETHIAIGEQDLGFAGAAGIENDLDGRRIAGVVLVAQPKIEIAELEPAPFPAPAHMNDPFFVRQHATKLRAGLRRARGFKLG